MHPTKPLRALARRPALALTVVLTLALGVGANAAMLGALDALLLRAPSHVVRADRLVRLYVRTPTASAGEVTNERTSYPFLAALRESARDGRGAIADAAGQYDTEVTLGSGGDVETATARVVTGGYFQLLGARTAAAGRLLGPDDDRAGAGEVAAVLGYEAWRRRFAGDPAVVGRALDVGALRVRVVGVAPRDLSGVDFARTDLWLPMTPAIPALWSKDALTSDGWVWLEVVARLRDGVEARAADAQATAAFRRVSSDENGAASRVLAAPLQASRGPTESEPARHVRWLALMSGALFLAAMATAAGLLVIRALERRGELAVRRSLGARPRDVARDVLGEAVVLAVAALAVAVGVAAVLGVALRRFVLPPSFAALPALDGRIVALAAVAAVVAAAIAAAAALVVSLRASRGGAMRMAGRGAITGGRRVMPVVVAAQVGLAFVLLLTAGLFARSLRRALDERIGFDTARVLNVRLRLGALGYDDSTSAAVFGRVRERLAALPDVEGVALAQNTPLRGAAAIALRVPGWDRVPEMPGGGPYFNAVTPDFFAVTGTRLLEGATPRAQTGAARQVVVSALMARTLWPRGGAIGRCMYVGRIASCATVVAVAEDARRFRLREDRAMQYYLVADFAKARPGALFVRARGADAATLVPAVRRALAEVDPRLPALASAETFAEMFAPNYAPWRSGATLLGAFALIAAVLCAVGVFGTVAYAAAQRHRELGLRAALGARGGDNVRFLMRAGLRPAAAGLLLGGVAFLTIQEGFVDLLYGTSPQDPLALATAASVLTAAVTLAGLLPARRAARADPAVVLRGE